MQTYALGHVANHVLLRELHSLVGQDRATTATLLAHIAEVDQRRLYADAAYGSMFDYFVRVLRFTEDMAAMRIRAARMARRFPAIFEAIADGRLTVAAVCLISRPAKGLSSRAAAELIVAAENKTKDEIRLMLAERFPQADLTPRVRPLAADPPRECVLSPHVPERVEVQSSSGDPASNQPIVQAEVDTTVANLRLRCPAHNQLDAERAFGAGFMEAKRAHTRPGGRGGIAGPPA